ncbi:MAG TPA: glycosyltransferase family 4 protein, partial [Anaeromyxobacter sp.]
MRILVVHQFYLQPGEPGGSRFNELARLWASAGHEVTVVAGTVNYATSRAPEKYRRRWNTKERDGGVTVWRCHVPETYGRSHLGRMWAFFAFTLSAATAVLRCERPDVVIATSPPLVAIVPGWLAARRHRARLVFEIRDLWPESAVTTGVLREGSLLTRLLYQLERWACRSADRINVLTPAFRDDLVRRGLAPAEKIAFVPNGADLDLFRPAPPDGAVRRELGWGDRFVVMYAGAHGRANAIGQLVEAAALLRDRPDILIASVGDGPERRQHEESARAQGLTNISFAGAQPKERMPALVNACDVGAAVLQANPTFRTVYPNKVFDYMACEKPTLLGIDGVARQLVCEEARAGV